MSIIYGLFKQNPSRYGYIIDSFFGVAIPLALTFATWFFRDILIPSNILLIYLLGVFFVAIQFSFFASILACLTIAVSFAFFFAYPIFSLEIYDFDNLIGLSIMLVVGTVTSDLTQKLRLKTQLIESKEQKSSILYRLSKNLSEVHTEREIIIVAVKHIHSEFKSLNTFLFPDDTNKLVYPNENPLNISLKKIDLDVANWAFNHKKIAGNGTDNLTNEPYFYTPLTCSIGTIGVLALEPIKLQNTLISEQYQFLDTFITQILQALERAKLAEQAKEATLKMQAEALRNSLLSSISHDLRTPLATIIGAASTLEIDADKLTKENRKKLVSAIVEEAQRMSELTTKILEMARLESGEVVLHKEWYAPEEIIGSALRCLDKKLKHRQVNLHIAQDLPLIQVDAVLLQQVIINLLDNAHKHSTLDNSIDICVEATSSALFISIIDSGTGVPENLLAKIFDKFFQVHKESAQSGVGLGLPICRAIVEAHGGLIEATNRAEGGLIIKFNLPVLENPPSIDFDEKSAAL
jgi:two-component system sensor histidine kinase KdpD